jgi:hypothetical protein
MHNDRALKPDDDLIPLGLLALELGESIDRAEGRFRDSVQLDDCLMRVVPAQAVRRFFAEKAEWKVRHEEERKKRLANTPQRRAPRGIRAEPGSTAAAIELMMAQERERQ